MERIPNKNQHRKITLEKEILPPLLPGFELATFRSRVRRCYQHAIQAPTFSITCVSRMTLCSVRRVGRSSLVVIVLFDRVNFVPPVTHVKHPREIVSETLGHIILCKLTVACDLFHKWSSQLVQARRTTGGTQRRLPFTGILLGTERSRRERSLNKKFNVKLESKRFGQSWSVRNGVFEWCLS